LTQVQSLVVGAFREGNLIPVGTQPSTAELTEGLDLFNRLLLSLFGFTVGEKLRDWRIQEQQRTGSVSRTYPLLPGSQLSRVPQWPLYPPQNARIVWDGSPVHAYFPERPDDGAVMGLTPGSGAAQSDQGELTLDGNGLLIAGQELAEYDSLAMVEPKRWFYRADLGDWLEVKALAVDEDNLFPPELDDLWICGVSIRMAPRYGKEIGAATIARVKDMQTLLRTRYAQSEPTPSGCENTIPAFESFNRYSRSWFV
jgi:hypothetical protein